VCRSIVPQPDVREAIPVPPPPPLEILDPSAPTPAPLHLDGFVLETDACNITIDGPDPIMLSIGPISHWWDDPHTYDVAVFIGGLDAIPEFQKHVAVFRNGNWQIREPVLRSGDCPS
jgi:hypothetical protein